MRKRLAHIYTVAGDDAGENEKTNMKNDKIISGQTVRKNAEHKGVWDILETRGGRLTGRSTFTGTMKEVREAIKEGNRLSKVND